MKFEIEVTRTETKTHSYSIEAETLADAKGIACTRAGAEDWNYLKGGDVKYAISEAPSKDRVQVYMEGLPQGEPMDPGAVEMFIAGLVKRYERQGYYFSCQQERIPVSEIRDRLITVGKPLFESDEEIDDDDEVEELTTEDLERAFLHEDLEASLHEDLEQRKEQSDG